METLLQFDTGKAPEKYQAKHRPQGQRGVILQVFTGADLRCMHDGLETLAKQNGLDVTRLEPGQYVVFINGAKDRCKVFASNNVVAYWKTRDGSKIDMRTISEIPKAFQGHGLLDYDKALKSALETALAKRARERTENAKEKES